MFFVGKLVSTSKAFLCNDCSFGALMHLFFYQGYALIEYENFAEAQAAISSMDGNSVLTQIVNVDWAFTNGSFLDGSRKKNPRYVLHGIFISSNLGMFLFTL